MQTARAKETKPRTKPTEVWDGLRFDIPGTELARQINRRVQYYEARAETYETKGADEGRTPNPDLATLERIQAWETLARNARARADFLKFQRDSLVTDVVYRVTDVMLIRLDLTFGQLQIEELPL